MPENTIKTIVENSAGYFWFVFLAIWGGTTHYISRIKKNGQVFSFAELIGEWSISAFAGIMTAYVCQSMQVDFFMTAALVGMAGHMGGRGLFMFETLIKDRWTKVFGKIEGDIK